MPPKEADDLRTCSSVMIPSLSLAAVLEPALFAFVDVTVDPAAPQRRALSDAFRATLDARGITRAAFAGVSLGGAVAQRIALDDPDRVAALALIATSARFGDPQQWHDRAATVRAGGTAAIAEATMQRWFAASFRAAQPAAVELMRAMFTGAPTEGYAACCEALGGWDSRAELGAVAAPTLVVVGDEDPATPPSHAREPAGGIPGARLEELPDAAHLVSLEKGEHVTALLRDHLEGAV